MESRGMSTDSIPPTYRSRRFADACPETCGLCDECASGCAVWFIGNGFCEPECNNNLCQFDGGDCWETDCSVITWSEWGECNVSCAGPGYQTRSRTILVKPTLGGKSCPEELEEAKRGCNDGVLCPIPCVVGEWTQWRGSVPGAHARNELLPNCV
eukprot:Selendium_serpulae@DN5127_c0_g2_i1.p2